VTHSDRKVTQKGVERGSKKPLLIACQCSRGAVGDQFNVFDAGTVSDRRRG